MFLVLSIASSWEALTIGADWVAVGQNPQLAGHRQLERISQSYPKDSSSIPQKRNPRQTRKTAEILRVAAK
jgi:hypothetical protein